MSLAWLHPWLPISCEAAGFTFGWVKMATFPVICRDLEMMTVDCKLSEGLMLVEGTKIRCVEDGR